MYQLLSINCKYRPKIKLMLLKLNTINIQRSSLNDKYGPLIQELKNINFVDRRPYRAVRGDKIDEIIAQEMNRYKPEQQPNIVRSSTGKYILNGSQTILAKIINEKLVVRVGGGYMSAADFIAQKSHNGVDMETLKDMIHNFGKKDFKILKLERCEE